MLGWILERPARADACAADMRLERIADPNGHLSFGCEGQHVRVEHLRSARGERVRFVVTEIVEEFRMYALVGVLGVDAVYIGPDYELVGIDNVGDDRAGKIGAVAAERGDAAVGGCTDEAGNDGNDAVFEERGENGAAAPPGLLEVRLGLAKRLAGEHELGRGNGNCRDAGLLECGGEQTRAETLAEGCELIEELGSGGDVAL